MSTIRVNSTTIVSDGAILIKNNRVFVDGKDVTPDQKEITIVVNGNVNKIEVDACQKVSITGDAGSVKTMSGDIDISGKVTGSVSTMSGDVDCGDIGGSVSTMSGDIKNRKH